jgi:hypothetical protein
MIDTAAHLEIRQSPWEMLKLMVLAVGFVALSLALALPAYSGMTFRYPTNYIAIAVGWVGFLFFGACLILIGLRAATTIGPVLSLTPEGILDTRVAAKRIPWTAIRDIKTWEYSGQRILVLDVDPEVEANLRPSLMTRLTRRANAGLGADGLSITTQGLSMSYDDLVAATIAYLDAYGRSGTDA